MNYIKIISFTFLIFINTMISFAQCGEGLIENAIKESGGDALLIKEFIVKLKKGKANRPERVAKFSTLLEDSNNYRFNIVNAEEFDSKVILQLFRKGKFLGSNYNSENQAYSSSFEFNCVHTDTYQILMSFMEGKAGCAAGILSIIVNDSTKIDSSHFSNIIYFGVKNPLYIAYTDEPGCYLNVYSNEAKIEGEKGKYTIEPNTHERVNVFAQTIDSLGTIREEIIKEFIVKELPIPILSINGNTGGPIDKHEILNVEGPELILNFFGNISDYKILSFSIATGYTDFLGINSETDRFSFQQLKFLKELSSGSEFYIKNVKVLMPNNKIVEISPLSFILH